MSRNVCGRFYGPWIAVLAAMCLAWQALPAAAEPLAEADLARLVELRIDDAAVLSKIQADGVAFTADDEALARLKAKGASDDVLEAVRQAGAAKPAAGAAPPITYQDILGLVRLGIGEDAILKRLEASPTLFTLDAQQVAELKNAGASDRLIAAMSQARPQQAAEGDLDILLVLDCSGSMNEKTADGQVKMEAAKKAVIDLIAKIPAGHRVSLIVYGHDKALACQAVKVARKLTALDESGRRDLTSLVGSLAAVGSTPIALALQTAHAELGPSKTPAIVALISDGVDTCKGDPVSAAGVLAARGHVRFGVVGFDLKADERAALAAIAAAGRGEYKSATSASELVQATQQLVGEPSTDEAPLPELTVVVEKHYSNENPLHSEFIVNGQTVDIFTSNSQKSLGKFMKRGWNTISIKTTPQLPANDNNGLAFRIGPVVVGDDGKPVMRPVLWSFRNDTDWTFSNRKFTHPLGPDTNEVELTYRVYYTGLDDENRELQDGDYVLQGAASYSTNTPVTGTVMVNGTPLNSFVLGQRQVVITPLLKQGRNEIRIVSSRVPNAIEENDVNFEVSGPARYNPIEMKFEAAPVCQFKSREGWGRDKRTGQLVNRAKAGEEQIERTIAFYLDRDPNSAEGKLASDVPGETAESPAESMMVFVTKHYSNENPLIAEFLINGEVVDEFNSNRNRPIDAWLKPGWNTISIKTRAQEPANDFNGLGFEIGPVHYDEKEGRLVMQPVLWKFRNDTDWKYVDGSLSHALGPNTKEVELNYRVYFAGIDKEKTEIANGDFVLTGEASYSANSPVTAAVLVNGAPLNSFVLGKRQVVITDLLKPGKNEVTIISSRVANAIDNNDISFEIAGPAEYNALAMKYEGKRIVQFKSMEGWERSRRTGQLINTVDAKSDQIERTIAFFVEE